MVSMCGRLTRFEWAVFGLSLLCYGTLLAAPEVMGPVNAEHSLIQEGALLAPRYTMIKHRRCLKAQGLQLYGYVRLRDQDQYVRSIELEIPLLKLHNTWY